MLITFISVLVVFLFIGLIASRYTTNTHADYYLASSRVHPALVGISAFASANSGYMFMGFIGYTYVTGLSSVWLILGWFFGDLFISFFVHPRFKEASTRNQALTYAGILSYWHGDNNKNLQRLIGVISIIFLLTYASAQFIAGSKAFYVLFDWPHWAGAALCAALIILYMTWGGMRASIWTDVAQAFIMLIAMALLAGSSLWGLGGWDYALAALKDIEGFLDPSPDAIFIPGIGGAAMFIVSWMFAGLAVIAQPHIMIRFITLDDPHKMMHARIYYYTCYFLMGSLALGVGLLARVYLDNASMFDPEIAVLLIAQQILPGALVGVVLAGIFAANISSADSLILSCAGVLTRNITRKPIQRFLVIKGSVVLLVGAALFLGLVHEENIFSLVSISWAVLGSAFAPLMIVLCLGWRPSQTTSMIASLLGVGSALLWYQSGGNVSLYEGFIGFLVGIWVHGFAAFTRALFGMRLVIESEDNSIESEETKSNDKA